jgi:hypothetical protein
MMRKYNSHVNTLFPFVQKQCVVDKRLLDKMIQLGASVITIQTGRPF